MDPFAFPVLAGTLLTEAVRFLFDRASAVLDRRAGRVPVEEPEQVQAQTQPLLVRSPALTDERVARITGAHGALRVYLSRPEFLQGDDTELRQLLGQIRRDLEEVYGCRLPFGDEKEADRPGVEVSQRADTLRGKQVGMRVGGDITERGRARVDQEAGTIEARGEQVGIEVEGTIG
ncbi:hypothetical protein GT204_08075 [Streptomyces sp. SID4919]|uniref:hypothetical protein n=1 Tax=Streptomyces sp. SID4919 TaxID=2690270 RepID=UPI000823BDBF|nr:MULTISPECIES: hypothetical protein [unclassified Streptomyces]MYY08861.1 hypothetical protein [Streptomyces sp. SID4919]SCK25915.1 hypothetical protein YW7DRAFT_01998 [Streptomyces sp. AmelKG-E11A]